MKYKTTIVIEWDSIPIDKGRDRKDIAEIVTATLADGACLHVNRNRNASSLYCECTFTETISVS